MFDRRELKFSAFIHTLMRLERFLWNNNFSCFFPPIPHPHRPPNSSLVKRSQISKADVWALDSILVAGRLLLDSGEGC